MHAEMGCSGAIDHLRSSLPTYLLHAKHRPSKLPLTFGKRSTREFEFSTCGFESGTQHIADAVVTPRDGRGTYNGWDTRGRCLGQLPGFVLFLV